MSALDIPVSTGRHSPLQQPAKCRCNNLQNRFATTYIFICNFLQKGLAKNKQAESVRSCIDKLLQEKRGLTQVKKQELGL